MDLSACNVLEDFYINMSSTGTSAMTFLKLPKSLKKLNLSNLRYITGSLDLSDMKELDELDIYYLNQITELNLKGCSSLKSVNRDDTDNANDSNTYSYCSALNNAVLTGCSALEYFKIYSGKLTSLDFSSSQMMSGIDIRSNKMEEDALIKMFNSLPDRSSSYLNGTYQISGNPGVTDAVKDLAESKGWY